MLYRLKQDSSIYLATSKNEKSVITNSTTKKQSVVDASGGVFLGALSHIPQSLETLVEKLLKTFAGVDAATITPDAKEFYDNFVTEGYLVSGETYADCNAAEYGWGYDILAAKDAQNAKPECKAYFHLPGLFELYDFYKKFLFIFYNYREFFYGWAAIGSIYGVPAYTIWNSGRERNTGSRNTVKIARKLTQEYGVSARFTFTNGLLEEKHLYDVFCNYLLEQFHDENNGVIINSDLLKDYIAKNFPKYYFASSTTKSLNKKEDMLKELADDSFRFVVPDYIFNNNFEALGEIPQEQRKKVEMMIDENCFAGCKMRKLDHEAISYHSLYQFPETEWKCPDNRPNRGNFSSIKKLPNFIGREAILEKYLPMGICNFKVVGRTLGEMFILEKLLYYMVKPEYQLEVREMMYLKDTANFPKVEEQNA